MKASDLHSLYGDVIPLNIFAEVAEVDQDNIKRAWDYPNIGMKDINVQKTVPPYFNIPESLEYTKPVHIKGMRGTFFTPHKDLIYIDETNDWVRLTCFANNSTTEQCTFVVDNNVMNMEAGRWYILNTRKTHHSSYWVDNCIHYVINLKLIDNETWNWLYSNIQFHQRKGNENSGENNK
jgi:hypothetical protein